jgi:hypothetical protein
MKVLIISKRKYVLVSEIPKALNLSKQRVFALLKSRKIDKIKIDSRTTAISLEDFIILRDTPRQPGNPSCIHWSNKNPENI